MPDIHINFAHYYADNTNIEYALIEYKYICITTTILLKLS